MKSSQWWEELLIFKRKACVYIFTRRVERLRRSEASFMIRCRSSYTRTALDPCQIHCLRRMVLIEFIIKICNVVHGLQAHSCPEKSEAKLVKLLPVRPSAVKCKCLLFDNLERNQHGIKVLTSHAIIVVHRPMTFYFRNANP